jgi:hypothetical protein
MGHPTLLISHTILSEPSGTSHTLPENIQVGRPTSHSEENTMGRPTTLLVGSLAT